MKRLYAGWDKISRKRLYTYCYIMFCSALIVFALISLSIAYPYLTNVVHEPATPTVQYYVLSNEKCHFYLQFETVDAFIATNPITVTVKAEPINIDKVKGIRLTFDGASQYFPRDYSENETWLNLLNDSQMANANILPLQRVNRSMDIGSDNPIYCQFSGQLSNLLYANAGSFDVYVQFESVNGVWYGYGIAPNNVTQNNPYILKQAITVSPAENALQIKSNSITIGLAWVGVSLPLMLAGLVGLIEFLKSQFFENKQPFECVSFNIEDSK